MAGALTAHAAAPAFLSAGDLTYRGPHVPVFVAATGSRLTSADGRVYVDAEAANGAAGLGYDASVTQEALARVGGLPALPSFCESQLRLDLAQQLEQTVSAAVGAPGRVAFELGGAQGVELAMKVVAANRGWGQLVTFQGAYHGRSPFTAHLSASARYRALLPLGVGEVLRLPFPDCEQCPLRGGGGGECSAACRAAAARVGEDHSGVLAGDVSALLLEPLLNVGGMTLPDGRLLRAAAARLQGAGALLVVDEVFTGFFRTGRRFGFELHGLRPDIVVLSKALTNGAGALSAVWAREPLLDPERFPPGTHSSTFAGTPLMLAVGQVVLARYAQDALWRERVARLERALRRLVDELAQAFPETIASGYALGGVARLLLRRPLAAALRAAALDPASGAVDGVHGVLVASTGMAPNVLALHPPLTIGAADLKVVRLRLHEAFGRCP
jgi:4-aminobutyrate aminotransferase-like enzyme